MSEELKRATRPKRETRPRHKPVKITLPYKRGLPIPECMLGQEMHRIWQANPKDDPR